MKSRTAGRSGPAYTEDCVDNSLRINENTVISGKFGSRDRPGSMLNSFVAEIWILAS